MSSPDNFSTFAKSLLINFGIEPNDLNVNRVIQYFTSIAARRDAAWRNAFKIQISAATPEEFAKAVITFIKQSTLTFAAQQAERLAQGLREGYTPVFKMRPTARVELISGAMGKQWVSSHEDDQKESIDHYGPDEPMILEPSQYPTGAYFVLMEPERIVPDENSPMFQEPE